MPSWFDKVLAFAVSGPGAMLATAALVVGFGIYKWLSKSPTLTIWRRDGTQVLKDTRRPIEWRQMASQIRRDSLPMPENWLKDIDTRIMASEQMVRGSLSILVRRIEDLEHSDARLEMSIGELKGIISDHMKLMTPVLPAISRLETSVEFIRESNRMITAEQGKVTAIVRDAVARFEDRLQELQRDTMKLIVEALDKYRRDRE